MERFGRFVLLEHLAQGGMAEVYRAASIGSAGFSRVLAIKRILPHLAADPHFTRLLIEEAHIASALHHPNIVPVLDLGEEAGAFFIAMEFVAGRSLNKVFEAARARETPLPPAFAVHAAVQVLHALHYAHTRTDAGGAPRGLIHRDVSPHNVMVAYDGSIKLADFGIAKVATHSEHTTGPIKGKPAYMSPEQVGDGPIDQRVDLYAVGVMLHELLAMRRLRGGDNPMRTLLEVAKGDFPRLETLGVQVPPAVAEAVHRALAPKPEDRWPDARAFCTALEDARRSLGWTWTAPDVAALMAALFPRELDQEQRTQEHFAEVVRELAQASSSEVSSILARVAAAEGEPTLASAKPVRDTPVRRRQDTRWAALGLGVLAALGSAFWAAGRGEDRPQDGSLRVESEPSGAQVWLDGRVVAGQTPLQVPGLAPGTHVVEVQRPGWQGSRQEVVVAAGGAGVVRAALRAEPVEIPLGSEPAGATVLVNGQPAGTTPTTLHLQGREPVDLELTLPGFASVRQRVLPERAPAAIHVELVRAAEPARKPRERPAPAALEKPVAPPPDAGVPAAGPGRLTLQSRPWARILVDGQDTGRYTPVVDLELAAGEHRVELVNEEDHLRDAFTVTIRPGAVTRAARTLR